MAAAGAGIEAGVLVRLYVCVDWGIAAAAATEATEAAEIDDADAAAAATEDTDICEASETAATDADEADFRAPTTDPTANAPSRLNTAGTEYDGAGEVIDTLEETDTGMI